MSNATTGKLIPWRDLTLYDVDGCPPVDADHLRELAQEFRDHGTISGYWFVSPTSAVDADGRQWCSHQQARVYPEDAGPRRDEVHFAGLD